MSSAPKPSDPKVVAAAQTGTNVSTAIANSWLNNPNEVGPDGTKTISQNGTYSFTDPTSGEVYNIPQQTITTTLSDTQQQIKDENDAASYNLAQTGNQLSSTIGGQLTDNFSLNNETTEARLSDLGRARLDPQFDDARSDLETQLSNQGIKLGSAAYDRAMRGFGEQENDAYNQLYLNGRSQASQELLAEDNQRINQINALLSGSQVSQPQFATGYNSASIAPTDQTAIYGNYDQANANAYAQKQAGLGSAVGALGGLFSLSDERAKNKMTLVGEVNGHNLYEYSFKGDGKNREIGVSAQEAEKKRPDAVVMGSDGFKRVNYQSLFGRPTASALGKG